MKKKLLIITGWAHGTEAVKPIGDALRSHYHVTLLSGAQVLRDRQIPDADFIATGSMGGLLSLELLPKSCQKLVLISSTAKFCTAPNFPHGTHETLLRRMILQLKRNPEAVLDEFFRNVHFPKRESRQLIALRKVAPIDLDELVEGLEYLLQSDVRERVPTIDIPVKLLHGKKDRIIPFGASEWLHEHLPESQLELIENDGHALPAHHFETVIHSIRTFLR